MNLGAFRDKFVRELSTGSRRIVDLAMCIAHDPSVLLLDEPSSGIAQAETEALGPLLQRIQVETGCALLVIEHDMPLITGVSDRMIALELGHPIVEGTPQEVISHPRVVESYLGGDPSVINRSGRRRRSQPAGTKAHGEEGGRKKARPRRRRRGEEGGPKKPRPKRAVVRREGVVMRRRLTLLAGGGARWLLGSSLVARPGARRPAPRRSTTAGGGGSAQANPDRAGARVRQRVARASCSCRAARRAPPRWPPSRAPSSRARPTRCSP